MTDAKILRALLPLVVLVAGCAQTDWGHSFEPRAGGTMFSPLDLPTPNRCRTASGVPGPDYWQQQVDYEIEATLDAEADTLTAHLRVTYTNNSPEALDFLWLNLEQNVFRPDSLASQIRPQASLTGRRRRFATSETDGYVIAFVRDASGTELDLSVYGTRGRLDLPTPIASGGGQFVFELDWQATVPENGRRHGIEHAEAGDIYELAQWFPGVCVYDDVHGWNTLPYLGTGEFYTNFGNYDVKLTVPRSHIVAATGVLQNPSDVFTTEQLAQLEEARQSEETVLIRSLEEVDDPATRPAGDGPLTWHFRAEDVRTFAWASSAAFIYDACDLDGVLVQSVYPAEQDEHWSQSTQMLRTAMKGYNERWHPYPYPEATNVYGREGGMEYPMIIFCRGRSERGLYGVTTHEIGHNWFPMMVNTDERRYAWMDEGFDTFINYYSTGDWFEGETGRRGSASRYARTRGDNEEPPIVTYADQLPRRMSGRLSYEKTGVGLVLLREDILGEERFDAAFRAYIQRWAFKSPQPADFFRTMENVSGVDLAWYWRSWFLEAPLHDQMLRSVTHEWEDNEYTVTVTVDNLEEMPMPLVLDVVYEDGTTDQRRYPVEAWFASNRYRAVWRSPVRADRVEIDADQRFPDMDRTNNLWRRNLLPSW